MDRRAFLTSLGAGAAAGPAAGLARAAMGRYLLPGSLPAVPDDKGYTPAMLAALRERGERRVYRGDGAFAIGMPVGGVCAGQVYILGDGTLGGWHVDGRLNPTGHGSESYQPRRPPRQLRQQFAIEVDGHDEERWNLGNPFGHIAEFSGEYPVANVSLRRMPLPPAAPGEPRRERVTDSIEVGLRAYSPFCPLNAKDSALPCTILRYTIRNPGARAVSGTLRAELENGVERALEGEAPVVRRNRVVKEAGLTAVVMDALPAAARPDPRPDRVIADFESDAYRGWTAEGEAFGGGPVKGTQPHQNPVSGFAGERLVNSFAAAESTAAGDRPTGTLTSDPFTVDRDYVTFFIGGGAHADRTCMNLIVRGKAERTATGRNSEKLEPRVWDVRHLAGESARLQIVDSHSAGWGHVNVDHIALTDSIPPAMQRPRPDSPGNGTMALAYLGAAEASPGSPFDRGLTPGNAGDSGVMQSETTAPTAHIDAPYRLGPGESRECAFVIAWHFPNLHTGQGQMYTNWFKDALEVPRYVRDNDKRLHDQTELFRKTYYEDTTLPWWLALRLMMPTANLATGTAQWWKNGRFWGWEGVGCCHGTCTHVWNYSHAEARLFPELARSTRVMQDLGTAFEETTGRVAFRGEVDKGFAYAADGQAGTVLKCYREHLCSPDSSFLKSNWPRIKKTLDYLIGKDLDKQAAGPADGVIEGNQHNTFDIDFVGPNTFVGSLYLASLLAGARMAELVGERDAAANYRAVAQRGRDWTEKNLFNGKWFTQRLAQGQDDRWQYGTGCLSDQLFGETWAGLLDLGHVYDPEKVRAALASVYRHNFMPSGGALGVYNARWPAEREFAAPREAGVLTCTWPEGGRPGEPVRYRDEVWTGIEYQVATGLLLEGMVDEALTIIKAIDDRYDGALHNPWNEVECGDHYARAMAAWGAYQALCGFVYDGPAGVVGLDPRLTPEAFRAFFAGSEGWGLISQSRAERRQENSLDVRWGSVRVAEFIARLPPESKGASLHVSTPAGPLPATARTDDRGRTVAVLARPTTVPTGRQLSITWQW